MKIGESTGSFIMSFISLSEEDPWCISDTHFGHFNIIKYCSRPYASSIEMDEDIISNWNSVVGVDDPLIHLGDVGLCSYDYLVSILNRLNGRKGLLIGNHDIGALKRWKNDKNFLDVGFDCVEQDSVSVGSLLFSHRPIYDVGNDIINIHGHIHANLHECHSHGINISVEVMNYMPVRLSKILKDFNK